MSLPAYLRRFFGRSAEEPATPTPADKITDAAFAGHTRMTINSRGILANTRSMEPDYVAGDTFVVSAWPFEKIKPGMVVLAWWEGRQINVPHRVLRGPLTAGNGETYFIMKGDNNSVRDSNLTAKEYVGLCVFDKDRTIA